MSPGDPTRSLRDDIFDSITDAILVLDADARIERVNRSTVQLTGFSEEELVGHSVEKLTRTRRFFEKLFAKSLHSSVGGNRFEMNCMRKDGEYFPISVSTSTIHDPGTNSNKLVCVASDITRRKRLEAESRAISRIVQGAASAISLDELLTLVHRTISKIVYAENFFVALFDPESELLTMEFWVDKYDPMPPPTRLGRSLSSFVFRQGRSMMFTDEDAKKLIEQGEVESVGTDSPIWLGVPLKTRSGIIGVLVVQDYENSDTYTQKDLDLLTSVADQIALAIERKRSEEALIRSQERFELVARATSDAVWDWNLATNEIWWNKGFQSLFGYSAEEVGVGFDSWMLRLHPDDSESVVQDIYRHIENKETNWMAEYRFLRADGSYAFVINRGYIVYDENKGPIRMLGSIMDVSERKSLEDQLSHQALHDPLTKIANRVLFKDRIDHALTKLARSNSSLAVLFLDLDNFKAVNDSLGHSTGDKLLICVAERLQDCLRGSDTAARFGGDEFAILMESMYRPEEATTIAERIIAVLKQPFRIDGKEIRVGSSIGIAMTVPNDSVGSDELLRNADLAMYMAKSQGKGKYVVFEPKMHEALLERIKLEEELRRGIDNGEFVIHYQPIFHLKSGKVMGIEALVRWLHPRLGLLDPGKFIPLAEETELIVPLGEWILVEACRQAQEWRREYQEELDLTLTVNISIHQFLQEQLVEIIGRALKLSGLPAHSLVLEITESFMIQDTEAMIVKLHKLKKLGIRLAIDDFGTGYSSLSYLQRFPIDILKIDKSFIDKLGKGAEGNAVARAIIMMAEALKLKTIAEGIENELQVEELIILNCEFGQGYHFAKPLTSDGVNELLLGRYSTLEPGTRSIEMISDRAM